MVIRTRIILGLIILASVIGGFSYYHSSNSPMDDGIIVVLVLLFVPLGLSATILLLTTFLALDEQGRIPYKSLAWRCLARLYGEDKVPEQLKICPTFWMLTILVAFFEVALFMVIMAILVAVYGDFKFNWIAIGVAVSAIASIALLIWLMLYTIGKNKSFWDPFWSISVITAVSVAMSADMGGLKMSMTLGVALVALAAGFGKFCLLILAMVVLAVIVVCLVRLLFALLPLLANSLIGKLISAAYNHYCLVIPVVTPDAEAEAEEAQ